MLFSLYRKGFAVDAKIPEIQGTDYRLYHVHGDTVEEIPVQVSETMGQKDQDDSSQEGQDNSRQEDQDDSREESQNNSHKEAQDGSLEVDTISFETPDFSQFVLRYTVGFHYENKNENKPGSFDFSINGGSTIALSELVEILGILGDSNYEDIDAFLSGIEDVTFSDENLLKVVRMKEDTTVESVLNSVFDISGPGEEETADTADTAENVPVRDGDWLLISLAPFDTAETLTIVMNDGEVIIIDVTDDQTINLAEYVTDATIEIEGRTYGAGETWPVREDVDYALKLTFKEKGSRQFPKGGEEMIMEPTALGGMALVSGQSGTFDIPMGLYGTVTGNQWWVDNEGKLHLQFGDDPNKLLTRSNRPVGTVLSGPLGE